MKQTLQLKLSQHLTLTPQLQQSIKLLQLSTLELNQEIERFLLENPFLEREDSPQDTVYTPSVDTLAAPGSTTDTPPQPDAPTEPRVEEGGYDEPNGTSDWLSDGVSSGRPRDDDDDSDFQDIQAAGTSLRDHLGAQIALTPLSERDRSLVRFIIEALDDDGYLSYTIEELLEMLPPDLEVEADEIKVALLHVQNLEPTGIGARSPQECLGLQLAALPVSRIQKLALGVVKDHLENLAARDFNRIKKQLQCSDEELREAHSLIMTLNPRPGAQYAATDTRYILPDVVVKKVRNNWIATLNGDAMPRLRVNRLYASILQNQRGSGLAGHLQEAKWLIKNVQQRFDTILRVSQAIVDRQRQFFEFGEVAMRPLTLREIAENLGLHESTISRVTTQKYMATPKGIFELKYFFGSHVATETGGACSATAIRALIKQLVGAEDAKHPLSDSRIAEILGQQGIVVARRTIAKYRESLNIPPVNLRKSI